MDHIKSTNNLLDCITSVDDTIPYVYHYYSDRKSGMLPAEARIKTTAHVGTAIVLASFVLFCGYALMIFGSLKTVELFDSYGHCHRLCPFQ